MKSSTKRIYDIAQNPLFIIIAGISSIVALAGWLYEKYDPAFTKLANAKLVYAEAINYVTEPGTLILAGLSTIFLLGFVYSIRVRWENMSLRNMSRIFYEINILYKEQLQKAFLGDTPISDIRTLVEAESEVLKAVCQRVARIYTMAIGRPCLVTIKLTRRDNDSSFAQTYVRSEDKCMRDTNGTKSFNLGTGENTGMDIAISLSGSALPPHFFSPDLKREKNYCNQRQHYLQYYKSIILVPIRGEKSAQNPDWDLVGFLSVDTMSTNRLNDRYHLYMLAALSHQMYNFLSLMRGRYTIKHGANYANQQSNKVGTFK